MSLINKAIVNGIHLTYYEFGKGQPVLFLHGGRLRATTFRSTLQLLSKQYRIIAPDIPGYGESSTPSALWEYRDYAVFFDQFIKHLKLKNVTIIGYSLGGGIAYHLASINEDISKLLLFDASGIEKSSTRPFKRDLNRILYYLTHPQYITTFLTLSREYGLFLYKHIYNLKHIKLLRKKLEESSSYTNDISAQTHIIWGKNDDIFPVEIAYRLHKSMQNSTIQIVDENHDWPIYKSKEFSELILKKLLPDK